MEFSDPHEALRYHVTGAVERGEKESIVERSTMQTMDIWQMIEEAPEYAKGTADLYHWSTNYDAGTGPFTMFLDLIGWSEDYIGEDLYNYETRSLGYLELSKLADALNEYSDRPTDVRAWVDEIMEAESAA